MAIGTVADDIGSWPRAGVRALLPAARRAGGGAKTRPGFPGSELFPGARPLRAVRPDHAVGVDGRLLGLAGPAAAGRAQDAPGTRRPRQPGTADIMEVVPTGPASAHATSSNRHVSAEPALIHGTAALKTAIKPDLRGSRLLLLVRHADAGDKHRWQGPDRLRPLSLAGQAEAAGLVIRLDDYPIGRILTSPTLRCHQTVQPLARDRRLRIEPESAVGVDADLARVLALLEDPRMQDTVVCTHGEVIGHVLTWLVTDGLAVDQPLQWPKGSTWLLDGANRRLTRARYLPPLVLAPAPSMASAPRGEVLAPGASSLPGV